MQGFSSGRVRVALLFLAAIVVAFVLSIGTSAPKSDAQVGYGAPQNLPDQVISPASSSHGSSQFGLILGGGTAVVILGGAVFYGYRHKHPAEHPYP
jgi:hypothetical protein